MATRRIIAESDGHQWTDDWADIDLLKGRVICVRCGKFRREQNKPCPGVVRVGPRTFDGNGQPVQPGLRERVLRGKLHNG